MSVWRTKAYDYFGFKAGSYSYDHGKVALFADLREMARTATIAGNIEALDRIFLYVQWADGQTAENLRSAADIEFFIPVLKDPVLRSEATKRLPEELLASKLRLIADDIQLRQ